MVLPAFADFTAEKYRSEIDEAMSHQLRVLEELRSDSSATTLENVLGRWEEARGPLDLWLSTFFTIKSADSTPELEQLAQEYAPKLAAHDDAINLDRAIYDRFLSLRDRIAANEIEADEEDRFHVEDLIGRFERAGVALNEADQEKLKAINERLAELRTAFDKTNRLARNSASLTVREEDLIGLATDDLAALRGDDGLKITLINTTQQPLAAKLANPELRKRLFEASQQRALGEHDTRSLIVETARLRAQRAQLLGYPSHAALVAAAGTAKTTEAIEAVLIPLAQATLAKARSEAEELVEKYRELEPGREFTAADWAYVEAQIRKERFAFDEDAMSALLPVNHVLKACYQAATDLYGIQFKLREDLIGHTSDAQVYEVTNDDNSPVGYFLIDLWARPSKNGGAWMTSINSVSSLSDELPIVTNNCNYRKAVPNMTWDEVITMFHEFGHALHGLFGKAKYPSRSGTSVPRDFVEFPSQVNEHWAWQPGRVLSEAWIKKLTAANAFGSGYAKAEALIAAVLDYVWHSSALEELPQDPEQVAEFERSALARYGLDESLVPPRYRSQYFAHIWGGGYAASYYGYSWAEVLDADAVAWFEENGGGTRENGDHFRKTLLSPGGSRDALETYRSFRGRDAELTALLNRLGIEN